MSGLEEEASLLNNNAGLSPRVNADELLLVYVELVDEVFHEYIDALNTAAALRGDNRKT